MDGWFDFDTIRVSMARVFLLIPLMFLFDFSFLTASASESRISYLILLVCGWIQTRGTWVDGFFHGAEGATSR